MIKVIKYKWTRLKNRIILKILYRCNMNLIEIKFYPEESVGPDEAAQGKYYIYNISYYRWRTFLWIKLKYKEVLQRNEIKKFHVNFVTVFVVDVLDALNIIFSLLQFIVSTSPLHETSLLHLFFYILFSLSVSWSMTFPSTTIRSNKKF